MKKIKKFCKKYYWILILVFAIGGSWWLSIRAWDYLHESLQLSLNNDHPLIELLRILFLMPAIALMWWHSPIWFQPLYATSMIWLFWQIYIRIREPV